MDKASRELLKKWNAVFRHIIKAEKEWNEFSKLMHENRHSNLNAFSYKARKAMAPVTSRSRFDIALPRLVDTWRRSGGLKNMLLDIPKYPKRKKKAEVISEKRQSE